MAKLETTCNEAYKSLRDVSYILASTSSLEPRVQFAIAEVLVLRTYAIYEGSISALAYKLASGAKYLNGKRPALTVVSRSQDAARKMMLNHGRKNKKDYLKWSTIKSIKESAGRIIDLTDPYFQNLQPYASIINEMRRVRNFVAHKNSTSRKDFKNVIREQYGVDRKYSAGKFLLANGGNGRKHLDRYIRSTNILIRAAASG